MHRTLLISLFIILAAVGPAFTGGTAEADDEGLTVYTYDVFPEALAEAMVDYMDQSHGVTLSVRRFPETGGVFAQLLTEKDDPQADVVIGLDNTYLARIYEEDLFVPYRPRDLEVVDDSLLVDPQFRAVPFDFGHIVLNYDSENLSDPPETWDELTDERYRDSIVLMDPRSSSPGRNFLLFTVAYFGEDGYLDYWRRLSPNILTFASTWSEGYGLYTQGEAPIVLSYDTSPGYHIYYEDTTRYRNLILSDAAYAQVEVAGIVRGTDLLEASRRLIDYIVSPEFQALIPLNQVMYPIHPGVELPEAFLQVERPDRIINLDEEVVADNFQTWLDEWESVLR